MRRSSVPLLWPLSLVVAVLGGCRGPTDCFGDFIVDEPLFNIVAVTDARTGASLDYVLIGDFREDDRAITDVRVVAGGPSSAYGIDFEANHVRCTVSCGFGYSQGKYEFTISRDGYQPLTVSVDARYGTVRGDCGYRHLSDGPQLRFELTPL